MSEYIHSEIFSMILSFYGPMLGILLLLAIAEFSVDAHFRRKMNELDDAIHEEFKRRKNGEEPRPLPKHLTKNSIF